MRVAFLTNILTPYRVFFFDILYELLGLNNLKCYVMTEMLPLRPWSYSDLKREYTELLKGKQLFFRGNDYLFSYNAIKAVSEFAPDVLIIAGSWTYPTTWAVMLSGKVKKKTKIFFWTESHNHTGVSNSTKTRPAIRKIKQVILKKFDGFCLPGKYALETITELIDLSQKKIVYLPNIVDNNFYSKANILRERKCELREEREIPEHNFVFFIPASMRQLKGQTPFFENVVDVVKDKPITFVLAGEGPDKNKIERIGKENDLDIRILDYQNQTQIREWYALSDAFLLPSLSDANPLSNIEAAWAGLPLCISCYVGNGPELVEDGVNGVIFDTLNKRSVCEKIEFVLEQDKEWVKKAGLLSHNKAEQGFDSIRESKKFVNTLETIWRETSILPGKRFKK